MKTNHNPIADGAYVREHRRILKDLCTWERMTAEEKQFFRSCHRCAKYTKYIASKCTIPCPCATCKCHKTEIQVDNMMKQLRKKYLEGDL